MHSFPMFIRTTDRKVVIAGGGEQAAQKARLILKTDAQLVLAAPMLDAELEMLVETGQAHWHGGPADRALFEQACMVFVATGCAETDARLHRIARQAGRLVNVVDRPDLCDITTPSIVDRDPVVVAIGTEGTAPVLARQIKTRVEELLPPNLGAMAAFAGRMRNLVARRVAPERRRGFWRWVFAGDPRQAWDRGAERKATLLIKSAIDRGRAPDQGRRGAISLIGDGARSTDLLTLRAVQRLQEADIIFYDRHSDAKILEYARRDAERVAVDVDRAVSESRRAATHSRVEAEARRGRKVVYLTTGGAEAATLLANAFADLRGSDLDVELVPGIAAPQAGSDMPAVKCSNRPVPARRDRDAAGADVARGLSALIPVNGQGQPLHD